ncbi:MAG TPA: DNA methyltransferase [Nitrososphaeraceae archaeon]|nr:DNA methyltransferase [Nitrososphaeraceae archaeon]
MEKEYNKILNKEAATTAKETNEFPAPSSKITIIKINPEHSKLVNLLSNSEYESLKNSIKEDGLHYPIVINSKGEILDGHHRYKICKELDIIPIKYEIKHFDNIIEEKRFVIDINLKRRQLNDFQKAELAYKLEDLYKQQARLRQLLKLKNVKDKIESSSWSTDHNDSHNRNPMLEDTKGKTIEVISKKNDISPKTYQRARTIIENATEEVKEKLRANKTTISKEYDKIQRDRKRQELLSQLDRFQSSNNHNFENSNYKLIYGDFIEQSQKEISNNSISLMLTDLPYGKEYLSLYHELAKSAVRVLKPGGSLVFYVGHIILDQVIKIFDEFSLNKHNNSMNLQYWWILTVRHSGHHQKVYPRHVFAEWKPLLWYVKGERVNDLVISNTIGDYIESSPPSKIEHDWQQSTIEAEYIIKNLTLENQTVLDPMMGSGTTGMAALNLNRRFIGIEKDQNVFLVAQKRLENYTRIKNDDD